MLNSGKKICALRDKKINTLTCVVEVEASWIFLFYWNFDFSSNHSIISISQFEFLPEKFFVCVNSYLPWNYLYTAKKIQNKLKKTKEEEAENS
jgi:hypothetical protein